MHDDFGIYFQDMSERYLGVMFYCQERTERATNLSRALWWRARGKQAEVLRGFFLKNHRRAVRRSVSEAGEG